ncbi:ABC transporter G family member 22 isoform X3 [Manihot esculenta]|uniref:ABC transporter G family member 22 isoform X3 n=1 Tax=Manihot esculenta TaxID=3983 RepID=UPI001CC7580C|nr:ABC transporter G family member 22 isoform X3 [Manihot esculenta]
MEVTKELGRELSERFGSKSSSTIQPEDNSDEAGFNLENKAAYLDEKLVFRRKSFSDSFLVNIHDLFDNVSSGNFDKTGNSAISQSSSAPNEDSDFCRLSKMQIEPTLPIAIKFQDVKYKVYTGKYILHGITGSANPGEILALMGTSGSGKTTLLNLLSGRAKFNSGAITYNDQPYNKSLNRRIGFVTQDDVVFSHLTVKETLTYAALLRLPNMLTREEKIERALNVIRELGLERSQNTVIGGKFVRGISGGERKRVCIGHEILLNPSLLLLDEPTSGLDSTTALRIVQILQDMAKAGKTVVTTVHQPSSRLFTMNPAEFLVDLANGNINDKSVPSELEDKFLPGNKTLETADVHEYLVEAYEAKMGTMEKPKSLQSEEEGEIHGKLIPSDWGATWWDQFLILVNRSFKERRHEYFSPLRITQVVATAIIVGLLWWNSDASSPEHYEDQASVVIFLQFSSLQHQHLPHFPCPQAGLLFFISVFWGFFPLFTAIFTFPQERAILVKERGVGMYRLSAYFAARNISDLPLDLVMPTVFLVIVYFMVGLKLSFHAFSLTLLTVFLSIVASQGLGLAIGAAIMDLKKATTLASIIMMTFMLSGGLFLQKVPSFMSWLRYVSFNYHTYRLLLMIQCPCMDPAPGSSHCQFHLVTDLRLDNGREEVIAMTVMIVAYRLLAYFFLRKMKLRKMA